MTKYLLVGVGILIVVALVLIAVPRSRDAGGDSGITPVEPLDLGKKGVLGSSGYQQDKGGEMEIKSTFLTSEAGVVLGGQSQAQCFTIIWEGQDHPSGAMPEDVLQAAVSRMQYLQGTNLGSDQNARALFAVLEALDHLNGTSEVTGKPLGETEE